MAHHARGGLLAPARTIEVRQIDRPNAHPVVFQAPPGLQKVSDLRQLMASYGQHRSLGPGLVVRVFDEKTQQYVVHRDDTPLPPDKTLRIALQHIRTQQMPLAQQQHQAKGDMLREQGQHMQRAPDFDPF